MKKLSKVLVMAFVVVGLTLSQSVLAGPKDDLKATKKATNSENVKEVKWFKVLVIDTKTNKEKVKVTLPLSLVEILADATNGENIKIGHCQNLDLKKLFKELKKVGPLAIVEVYEENEHVKVWLE